MKPSPSALIDHAFLRRLDRLQLISRRGYGMVSGGGRRSRRFGSSIEFADYRNYSPGDDFRHVDWNVFGRSNRLYIKLREAEEHLAVHVLVDGSRSMDWGRQSKFAYAKSLAGSLGYIALNRDDVLSAAVFSETIEQYFAPVQGRAHILRFFNFLEQAKPVGGATSLVSAIRNYVARNAQRGLVILISDMMTEDAYRGITAIQEAGNELVLLHVLDWAEIDPELSGELSLVDRETGRSINVSADAETLNQYREHALNWADQLEVFCGRRNARYVRLETSWPLEEVVFQRLLRRVVL